MSDSEATRRSIAMEAMQAMADKHGFPLVMREEDRGEHIVFVGTAPDGREFCVGYEKGRGNGED